MTKKNILFLMMFISTLSIFSQTTDKKFWLSGLSRGLFNIDNINSMNDTISLKKAEYGHTLVDLSANIKPNNNTYIRSSIRVRNEYGGFWGSGVTFDLRELYLRGLISNSIRYQIGDMDYKMTPFTFYNNSERFYSNSLDIFGIYNDIIDYDNFYFDNNTWRQQGGAIDFSLTFNKNIDEMKFNFFTSRINTSDFNSINDRIFFGTNISIIQSKKLNLGLNYINLKDISGTSLNNNYYKNPVFTGTYNFTKKAEDFEVSIKGESGFSNVDIENNSAFEKLSDYFNYSELTFKYLPLDLTFKFSYRNVGQNFRSVGSQMRRLNYSTQGYTFNRYTNDLVVRPIGIWDIYNDASLFNNQIQVGLGNFYPQYNNIDPYGLSTPNRKGFNFELVNSNKYKKYDFTIYFNNLSEIVGVGTNNKRNYKTYGFNFNSNLANFMNFNKSLKLQLNYNCDKTKRDSNTSSDSYLKSNLSTSKLQIGLNYQISGDFYMISGYEKICSSGKDHISLRNQYDQINNLRFYETNLNEEIFGLGFEYKFDSKNNLKFIWQNYNWSDQLSLLPDYEFSRFSLIYLMKF